jgi:hypothetical protein
MKAVRALTTSFNIILPATAKHVNWSLSISILDRTKQYIVMFVHMEVKEMKE